MREKVKTEQQEKRMAAGKVLRYADILIGNVHRLESNSTTPEELQKVADSLAIAVAALLALSDYQIELDQPAEIEPFVTDGNVIPIGIYTHTTTESQIDVGSEQSAYS